MGSVGNGKMHIEKTVFDTAQIKVYYSLEFKKDSMRNDKTEAQTILLIGNKYTVFTDYNKLLADSVADDAELKKKNPILVAPQLFNLWSTAKYKQSVLINLYKGVTTVRENMFNYTYEYDEITPAIEWNILPEDSVINGLACKKATCHFRGRDYIAWYLKDVPLPYGPYRFNGLPGLIAMIKDTGGNYCFTLNGAEDKPTHTNLIYLDNESIYFIKDTRDKILTTIRQAKNHPAEIMLQDPIIKISPDVAKKMDRSPDPYNPIELE